MRLIDADKIVFRGLNQRVCPDLSAQDEIDEQPTIDPIYAAGGCYCRECRYYQKTPFSGEYLCRILDKCTRRGEDDFCSRGEVRKKEEP